MKSVIAISAATLAAAGSPVSIDIDADLRKGSMNNIEASWAHSYEGFNVEASHDRNKHDGFLHKLRVGRNLFSKDDSSLDVDVTYDFAKDSMGVEARADVQGLGLNVEHDTSDKSTSVEARYNVQDTDIQAEFSSGGGLDAVEVGHSFDVGGNDLRFEPRFEVASKVLKSKLRYALGNSNSLEANVQYGIDDKSAAVTAEYAQDLDNGDHLTVHVNPDASEVSAKLETKLGGDDSDPSWELNAKADYSKGSEMMDGLTMSARRRWSF